MNSILVVVGPTASGKTETGIALAGTLNGEILSADSRQIYRGLDIGTAKPTAAQRSAARHHFIDILDPDEEYNAGRFGEEARGVAAEILARGKTPIVVGGAGLYIRALVDGLHGGPGADRDIRRELERRGVEEGLQPLLRELQRVDLATARRMRTPTLRRVVRALEVYHSTGIPLSAFQERGSSPGPWSAVFAGLLWERSVLYDRINARCGRMVEEGLLAEIERLEKEGYGEGTNALNTVGYKEGRAYRSGAISFTEMLRLFRQNTRRYAKRQMTWFRADSRITWFRMEEGEVERRIAEHFLHSR